MATYASTGNAYFLSGVVTGRERNRFDFMTSGFSLICGPSDDRPGRVPPSMGGGGPDTRGSGSGPGSGPGSGDIGTCGDAAGEERGSCGWAGGWYSGEAWIENASGVGAGSDIAAEACVNDGSSVRPGTAINCEFMSNWRVSSSQGL